MGCEAKRDDHFGFGIALFLLLLVAEHHDVTDHFVAAKDLDLSILGNLDGFIRLLAQGTIGRSWNWPYAAGRI